MTARGMVHGAQSRYGWLAWLLLAVALAVPGSMAGIALPVAGAPGPDEAGPVSGHYEIDVVFDPERRTLTGSIALEWTNLTGVAAHVLPFRLYPASDYYPDGDLSVSNVRVYDEEVDAQATGDGTVLEVFLGYAVEPMARTRVTMDFETTIPTESAMSVTVLAGSSEDGWWLADWYPILAGWTPGEGWYLEGATPFGDPTFSDTATYEVTLSAPGDLRVVGTGEAVASSSAGDGLVRTSIATGPVREMTLALLADTADSPVEVTERVIDGVLVRVSLPAGKAVPGLAEAMLEIAGETLPHYQAWMGAYPGVDLDLSPVSLSGFGGIAWSGAVWIDIETIVNAGEVNPTDRDRLRFVLAHELAHQWVPVVVGSNNNRHGFLSEGLGNTLAVLAIRESGDAAAADRYLRDQVAAGYLRLLESGVDGVADAPVGPETDMGQRGVLVYGKDFRFANTVPEDLSRTLEEVSGMGLDNLWSFWFLEAGCTPDDVHAVLDGFSG